MENAVQFYMGYTSGEEAVSYLPAALVANMKHTGGAISFKNAMERQCGVR